MNNFIAYLFMKDNLRSYYSLAMIYGLILFTLGYFSFSIYKGIDFREPPTENLITNLYIDDTWNSMVFRDGEHYIHILGNKKYADEGGFLGLMFKLRKTEINGKELNFVVFQPPRPIVVKRMLSFGYTRIKPEQCNDAIGCWMTYKNGAIILADEESILKFILKPEIIYHKREGDKYTNVKFDFGDNALLAYEIYLKKNMVFAEHYDMVMENKSLFVTIDKMLKEKYNLRNVSNGDLKL